MNLSEQYDTDTAAADFRSDVWNELTNKGEEFLAQEVAEWTDEEATEYGENYAWDWYDCAMTLVSELPERMLAGREPVGAVSALEEFAMPRWYEDEL
jgi:hypothetical protein